MTLLRTLTFSMILLSGISCFAEQKNFGDNGGQDNDSAEFHSWWPEQKSPRRIVVCSNPKSLAESNLAQSLSGNIAAALNEGRIEEGIWINYPNSTYKLYLKSLSKRIGAEVSEQENVWSLLEKYSGDGFVSGYVLYDINVPATVNIATVRAAVLNAVIVDRTLEQKAVSLGLKKLYDASCGITEKENFEELKDRLNNNAVVLASPSIANNRDFAIAYRTMVYYGVDEVLDEILEWARPLSPVIGWNCGPESGHIRPCTEYGLINTVSDFCVNLPMILCSPSDKLTAGKFKSTDPKKIDWSKDRNCHSFLMSDGDNMQWTLGNFMYNENYWASSYCSKVPVSFTTCGVNMSMAANDPLNSIIRTQPRNTAVVEYMGGYYYPDLFAVRRSGREAILHDLARAVGQHMGRLGVSVLGFICMDIDSGDAMRAYRIFAEEIEDLTGMVAMQYNPYNGGNGDIFWVKGRRGENIPVCTARYQLWANLPIVNSGNPADIAEAINVDASKGEKRLDFTVVHAWSKYRKDDEGVITDVPHEENAGTKGVEPVFWCSGLLDPQIDVVPIDELLWRIRMKHHPQETEAAIKAR